MGEPPGSDLEACRLLRARLAELLVGARATRREAEATCDRALDVMERVWATRHGKARAEAATCAAPTCAAPRSSTVTWEMPISTGQMFGRARPGGRSQSR